MLKVMLIEDDPAIQLGLEMVLKEYGFSVTVCDNGVEGFQTILKQPPDCILLDIMLPGMMGTDVLRNLRLRGISIPVIMLTNKTDEIDRIIGLELGADDYITKPFSAREVIARIKAILRRIQPNFTPTTSNEYTFGNVVVNILRNEVTNRGEIQKISSREFDVLMYFLNNEGKVITREMLLDEVWGYDVFPTTRTVDNYILMLRKKIENIPSAPRHLLTMHTSGYKFIKIPIE